MSTPNTALRQARQRLHLSQDELARAIRQAGDRAGEPNSCTKQIIPTLGSRARPHPPPAPTRELWNTSPGRPSRPSASKAPTTNTASTLAKPWDPPPASGCPNPVPRPPQGPLTGIWLSTYEYTSSGREQTYIDQHHVLLIQHGRKLQARSLLGSAPSKLMMDLTINGQVITGTWTEETNPAGYYQGSTYHGAIQLLSDPTGHRLTGQWVGFGRDFDVDAALETRTPHHRHQLCRTTTYDQLATGRQPLAQPPLSTKLANAGFGAGRGLMQVSYGILWLRSVAGMRRNRGST